MEVQYSTISKLRRIQGKTDTNSEEQFEESHIGRAYSTYDELFTSIVEIESIVNARPLCYLEKIEQ